MQFQISSRRKSRKAGEVEPPTKFSKRGGLDRTSTFRGGCWERGGDFFQGGCNFHIKIN